GGLAAYPIARAGSLTRATVPLAVIALLLVLISIAWRGRLTGIALFVLAGEYLVVQVTDRVGTFSVVGYAVGLVALCEFLFFGAGLPTSGTIDWGVIVERLLRLTLTGAGAAVVAILVLAAGGWRTLGAVEAAVIGMVAAVLLCGLPWVLMRRRRHEDQRD
ncbi:MAG: hypothetical protein JW990_14630, partial [Thermoleophilia bacterium]|nr:hypothetical protein [Thermoleophilia bacterium]